MGGGTPTEDSYDTKKDDLERSTPTNDLLSRFRSPPYRATFRTQSLNYPGAQSRNSIEQRYVMCAADCSFVFAHLTQSREAIARKSAGPPATPLLIECHADGKRFEISYRSRAITPIVRKMIIAPLAYRPVARWLEKR